MAGELFILKERGGGAIAGRQAEGIALAKIIKIEYRGQKRSGPGTIRKLTLTTETGKLEFKGAEAAALYTTLRGLSLVV